MAKQDTGCISYISVTSIIIMSIYVLFTNAEQFFESAFNILSSLVIIVLIVFFAIFFPNFSTEQKKEKPEIKSNDNLNIERKPSIEIETKKSPIAKHIKKIPLTKKQIFVEKEYKNSSYGIYGMTNDNKAELKKFEIFFLPNKEYKGLISFNLKDEEKIIEEFGNSYNELIAKMYYEFKNIKEKH
jgi:hypothetical protein